MKRTFWIVLSTALLAVLLTWGGNRLRYEASAQDKDHEGPIHQGKAEVVVIVCETDIGSVPPVITVLASSSSRGAPTVSVGSECAQALASVLTAGFRIRDAASLLGLRVQYTLRNK